MSAADNIKCDICGNNHHPMTECRDALRSLASAPFRLTRKETDHMETSTQSALPVPLARLVRVFIAPEDQKPWETIGRALGVASAWPDPSTGEESTPQAVWNWIDKKIGGRGNRKWEDAPRGKHFIANANCPSVGATETKP